MKRTISYSVRADVCELAALLAYALDRCMLDERAKGDNNPKRPSLAAIERIARASAVAAIPSYKARFASPAAAWKFLTDHGLGPRQDPTADGGHLAPGAFAFDIPDLVDYAQPTPQIVDVPALESA